MTEMTGAAALIESVLQFDVDTVFGLPGGQIYDVFDALHQAGDRVNVVTSRHEQGAAYMAYGYAHSTGRVGVFTVVPGPGLLNTTAALCTAYGASAKVLAISGQIPTVGLGVGAGYLHELPDQLSLIRGVTKWAERIDRPEDAPALVREAFKQLHSGRPRPVELEMCMDVTARKVDMNLDHSPLQVPRPEVDTDLIKAAADILGKARRPLIMVGGGARDASAEVRQLAELLQAPVVCFRHGKGVMSDDHYLSQSYPAGNRLWKDTDAVLAVGTRLKYPLMYWGTQGLDIVRIDLDESEIDRVKSPAVGIVADAADALSALIPAVENVTPVRSSIEDEMLSLKQTMREEYARLTPQVDYIAALRNALPRDGIFVDEVTQVGFVSWFTFPVYEPRHFVSAGYQGTLGYGYATALGVKVGNPDKKVLQISGDGGIMFNIQEVATAVQNQLQVVTVIFKDNRFGNVNRDQNIRPGKHVLGTEFVNPDFVKLAEAFGAAGERVDSPQALEAAIARGFDRAGPTLIEVPVDRMPSPWPYIGLPQVRE